jgi:hypothetical protein
MYPWPRLKDYHIHLSPPGRSNENLCVEKYDEQPALYYNAIVSTTGRTILQPGVLGRFRVTSEQQVICV